MPIPPVSVCVYVAYSTTQLLKHTAHPSLPGNIVAVHIDKCSLRLANPHITCECLCVCCILHYSAIGTPPSLPTNIVAVCIDECSFLLSAHTTCECLCMCCILDYSAIGAHSTAQHPPHCHGVHPSLPSNIVAVHNDKYSFLLSAHTTCECLCVCCILDYSAIGAHSTAQHPPHCHGVHPSLPSNIVAVHNDKYSFLLSAHTTCECLCVCCILDYSAIGAHSTAQHPPHCHGVHPSLPSNIVAVHNDKCSFLLSAHITCERMCDAERPRAAASSSSEQHGFVDLRTQRCACLLISGIYRVFCAVDLWPLSPVNEILIFGLFLCCDWLQVSALPVAAASLLIYRYFPASEAELFTLLGSSS